MAVTISNHGYLTAEFIRKMVLLKSVRINSTQQYTLAEVLYLFISGLLSIFVNTE